MSQQSSNGSLATESTFDHSLSTLSKTISPDGLKGRLFRLTWLYVINFQVDDTVDAPRLLKLKPSPSVSQKPRPWSMVTNTEAKTTDLSLLSDGSSPNNSTGNTPDSAEALDSSESSSIDRRLGKELKLKKSLGEFWFIKCEW